MIFWRFNSIKFHAFSYKNDSINEFESFVPERRTAKQLITLSKVDLKNYITKILGTILDLHLKKTFKIK